MPTSSAPGLDSLPPDLINWLRAQSSKYGVSTPADVSSAAAQSARTALGAPNAALDRTLSGSRLPPAPTPSTGPALNVNEIAPEVDPRAYARLQQVKYGYSAPAELVSAEAPAAATSAGAAPVAAEAVGAGEAALGGGSTILKALGGFGPLGILATGASLAPSAMKYGDYIGDLNQPSPFDYGPGSQVARANKARYSTALDQARRQSLPTNTSLMALSGGQPTMASDTQGGGSQSASEGSTAPVPASQETPAAGGNAVTSPSDLSSSAPNGASPGTSANTDATAQPQGGVTLDQIVNMLAQSTKPGNAWQPTPVQAPANTQAALQQVLQPNADNVKLDANGNAPGVSTLQRILAAGAGPIDWHRADKMRIEESQLANQLTQKEQLQGQLAGNAQNATNDANIQLQKEASAAGGVSPQMKMIMDIMGGQLTAGAGMRAKLAEIGAETAGKVAVERAKPEALAFSPAVMQQQAALKAAEEKPDLFTPQRLMDTLGIKNYTADDLAQTQAALKSIAAARQFSPEKYMDAQLLQSVIDKINQRNGVRSQPPGNPAQGPSTGGVAPGSGGRPSNLNLSALQH